MVVAGFGDARADHGFFLSGIHEQDLQDLQDFQD